MLHQTVVTELQEPAGISRRFLLRAGMVGLCACFFPWPAAAKSKTAAPAAAPAAAATPPPPVGFYLENKAKFLADFKGVCAGAEKWMAARVSEPVAKAASSDALRRFEILLPTLPDLGGASNRNQPYITMAGWLTALFQAMREKGMAAKDAGRLLYDLCAADWAAIPPQRAQAMGAALFSPASKAALQQWAEVSQKRLLPADWVGTFIPGDGKNFDLGYDYSECGAVKYFKSQGVPEVAPYYCLNDFLASRAQGTGLARQHTLAQGDTLCDFRYKQGRAVTQDWNTETPRFEGKKPV
ncbi:MAG: L-2-amino-thiazoline-4-carboxylic acid hydrolase [Acidobacteriota bacterium]